MRRASLIAAALVVVVVCATAYHQRHLILRLLPAHVADAVAGALLGFRVENADIVMRDGIKLSTRLYLPTHAAPPYAAVLLRSPYGKGNFEGALEFVRRGLVFAVQDMRGRGHSEGRFAVWPNEARDGSDTIDWIARQPWSSGRVGTFGCSAAGEAQIPLAALRNPHHAALVARGAGGGIGAALDRHGYFGVFEGGVFNLASGFGWFLHNGGRSPGARLERPVDVARAVTGLPIVDLVRRERTDPTDFEALLSTPPGDPRWKAMGFASGEESYGTPALHFNTWHDQTIANTFALAELMKRNWSGSDDPAVHVIVAPGNHCDAHGAGASGRVGDLPLGPGARQPYYAWFASFFDRHLRHAPTAPLPPYLFYVLGEDRWAQASTWPPEGVRTRAWYLGGAGPANSAAGAGTLDAAPAGADQSDAFRSDPTDPVPTRGGPICCTGNQSDRAGPLDQREVERRRDVLVYTSAPLEAPLRVAGPLAAELFVSSSAPDSDLAVKLVDVWPDGTALNVQEGALRLRYRDGFPSPKRMQPGTIYRVRVDLRAIAYLFPAGHRLRLQIAGSNFPRLERNLNTGGRNYDETAGIVALNRIHTGKQRPSALLLPEWPQPRYASLERR